MEPSAFNTPPPAERTVLRELEDTEVRRFYRGRYQEVRRYYAQLFPTANWRIENIAFMEWTRIAEVPPYVGHDGGVWTGYQCQRLASTADAFKKHLEDVKAGAVEKPEWAKQLSAKIHGPSMPHGG